MCRGKRGAQITRAAALACRSRAAPLLRARCLQGPRASACPAARWWRAARAASGAPGAPAPAAQHHAQPRMVSASWLVMTHVMLSGRAGAAEGRARAPRGSATRQRWRRCCLSCGGGCRPPAGPGAMAASAASGHRTRCCCEHALHAPMQVLLLTCGCSMQQHMRPAARTHHDLCRAGDAHAREPRDADARVHVLAQLQRAGALDEQVVHNLARACAGRCGRASVLLFSLWWFCVFVCTWQRERESERERSQIEREKKHRSYTQAARRSARRAAQQRRAATRSAPPPAARHSAHLVVHLQVGRCDALTCHAAQGLKDVLQAQHHQAGVGRRAWRRARAAARTHACIRCSAHARGRALL